MSYETILLNRYKDFEELSIRQEVIDFFTGFDFGEEKKTIYICQRIRRDKHTNPRKCQCWDNIRNEGKKGCFNCGGSGFQFDEEVTFGYITNIQSKRLNQSLVYQDNLGRNTEGVFLFYTQYDKRLYTGDIILDPVKTDEGYIDNPLTYQSKYIITNPFHLRLDEGRSEYNIYSLLKVQ